MDIDMNFINAIDVAKRAHKGQLRKYTKESYITHPFAVAGLVVAVSEDDDMVCAALLHDVVEDSDIELKTIEGVFGQRIASMVSDLTNVSRPEDGNRKKRKAIDLEHTAKASKEAKTIKLADLIDNTKSITAFDSEFSKIYMAEKRLLLDVLGDGDVVLFKIASDLVKSYYAEGN